MDEITKTATSEAIKTSNGVFAKMFGPAAEQIGMMIAIPLKERVLRNQMNAFERVQKLCIEKNISLKQINLKVMYPYLEGVAVEEDNTLQGLWANLIVNYMDSEKNLSVTVYPEILKQMSTRDVELLKEYFDQSHAGSESNIQTLDIELRESEISNILRLGLIREKTTTHQYGNVGGFLGAYIFLFNRYEISAFGKAFYEACRLD